MKRISICLLALSLLMLTQCKKDQPGNGTDPDPSGSARVLDATNILRRTDAQFIQIGRRTNGTAHEVLALTAEWLKTETGVKEVILYDSLYIYITTAAGIVTEYGINLTDDQGRLLYRGGRNKNGGSMLKGTATSTSSRTIGNKKVLIYAAEEQFYNPATIGRFQAASPDFDVVVRKGNECTPRLIESFGDYGMVIINTHGDPEGFLAGTPLVLDTLTDNTEALVKSKVEAQVGTGMYDKLLNDHLRLGFYKLTTKQPAWQSMLASKRMEIYVTSSYVESLPAMPGTVIFGNMCHSGYTHQNQFGWPKKPIATAFNSRGLISYFSHAKASGESFAINDHYGKRMEDSLVYSLLTDGDSTGNAHLDANGEYHQDSLYFSSFSKAYRLGNFFRQSGSPHYSYDNCPDSFTDARDGRMYDAVCIGGKTWMAENLRYEATGSVCYDNTAANCETYGRLYKWNMLQGVCPSGWHLPSHNEWQQLSGSLGGATVSGGALKAVTLWDAPNTGATNVSGFSGLPGGVYVTYVGNPAQFNSLGKEGYFWSSTPFSADRSRMCNLRYDEQALIYGAVYIAEAYLSVRCVKNE